MSTHQRCPLGKHLRGGERAHGNDAEHEGELGYGTRVLVRGDVRHEGEVLDEATALRGEGLAGVSASRICHEVLLGGGLSRGGGERRQEKGI